MKKAAPAWQLDRWTSLHVSIGTVGDEAWRNLRRLEEMEAASFGLRCGSGAVCIRPAGTPHLKGEWISADM